MNQTKSFELTEYYLLLCLFLIYLRKTSEKNSVPLSYEKVIVTSKTSTANITLLLAYIVCTTRKSTMRNEIILLQQFY